MSQTRILNYAPYNAWPLHATWEMTIMHALRLRGAEVKSVFCDGQFHECDIHWKARAFKNPRTPFSCIHCQAKSANLASKLISPYEWLSKYLETDEIRIAEQWAESVPREDLITARYNDWEIGDWVKSSVHSHFRTLTFDFSNPEIEKDYRRYLYSGLVAAFAHNRILDEFKPDVIFLLHGRFSSIHVLLQLAQKRGIRVITHERGLVWNSLRIVKGMMKTLDHYHQMWKEWKDIPLSEIELKKITDLLNGRRNSTLKGENKYSPVPQSEQSIRKNLNLDASKPLWTMFISSDDESATMEKQNLPFGTQDRWILDTIEFARNHPEIELVIRAHPNIKGKHNGTNQRQFNFLLEVKENLPPNARMVLPEDDVSTYSLMDMATLVLVFRSTTSLESACNGKYVVVGAECAFRQDEFLQAVRKVEDYKEILSRNLVLPLKARSNRISQLAFRFAYGYFYRYQIHSKMVRQVNRHALEPIYNDITQLLPGNDRGVDRICGVFLNDNPVLPPPSKEFYERSEEAELNYLSQFSEITPQNELVKGRG